MKVLLTGANGYIGQRLLAILLKNKHEVYAVVRDALRFDVSAYKNQNLHVIEADFLKPESLHNIPKDLDVAYYLIHSMSQSNNDFSTLEKESAINFSNAINSTQIQQVIYLSGIVNDQTLSKHLNSRFEVERILGKQKFALTTLRSGIIVGSGSSSFEIIRDLVEKLPVMITPKWLNTLTQPIAIRNVLEFLSKVMLQDFTYNKSFDIGGPEVMSYKNMLLKFAKQRNLKRYIISVPVMTPRLSSYWLYFVTSTSYALARNLVESMHVEVIAQKNDLAQKLNIELITYEEAILLAFDKIKQQEVISSWTDALSSNTLSKGLSQYIEVPDKGCFIDSRSKSVKSENKALEKIWSIGGINGWYSGNFLWRLRGFLDKLFGGVGLRRGRRDQKEIFAGDALDFWRVLYADKEGKRLLLYAEMKLPGEAWLEFKIKNNTLHQTATFRPLGLWGRLYWYAVLPFHGIIFRGMLNKIAE